MPSERLRVRVKPGSRRGPLVETSDDDVWVVHVRERAVDGEANAGVIAVVASHMRVPTSWVSISVGHTARIKTVVITRP